MTAGGGLGAIQAVPGIEDDQAVRRRPQHSLEGGVMADQA